MCSVSADGICPEGPAEGPKKGRIAKHVICRIVMLMFLWYCWAPIAQKVQIPHDQGYMAIVVLRT